MIIVVMGVAGSGKTTIGMMLASTMKRAETLASQFPALEEPSDTIVVDVSAPPGVIVEQILVQLHTPHHGDAARPLDR